MKLCDFQYNYMGHYLKKFSVDSKLRCSMATLLSRTAWLKLSGFREKWSVFHSERIHIGLFSFKFEISA